MVKGESSDGLQQKLSQIRREAEERAAARLAKDQNLPYTDLRKTPIAMEAIRIVSEAEAKESLAVPLQVRRKELAVAITDLKNPTTQKLVDRLKNEGYELKTFIASRSGIEEAWHMYSFATTGKSGITGKIAIDKEHLNELSQRLKTIPSVQEELSRADFKVLTTTGLFEIILAGALPNRVSDIHLEAVEKKARLRFRIDGALHDIFTDIPQKNYEALMSRIKLLSGLKINVRGEPQDGRFTVGLINKEIEMRVSIIPSEFGETVVMRVLDPDSINIDLAGLGLREDDLVLVERNLARPNGLILNTGPTGSGKTTTLYAFLRRVNKPDIKIITVEDPIEYHLKGVEQTQANADVGYTFASGLRSILRQDPDVILVGEVRDLETAEIAMQASLTGHIVFSTLHTNDAVGAVARLSDLGVKPTIIGPALTLVIAQRLVRRLCLDCKKQTAPSPELLENIKGFLASLPSRVSRAPYEHPTVYEAGGCPKCNMFGYRGRVAIYEFFEVTPDIEELILKEASETSLLELAKKHDMVSMQADGILKVLTGVTTLSEVEDVTGALVWDTKK